VQAGVFAFCICYVRLVKQRKVNPVIQKTVLAEPVLQAHTAVIAMQRVALHVLLRRINLLKAMLRASR
jgi:hypothetical protein